MVFNSAPKLSPPATILQEKKIKIALSAPKSSNFLTPASFSRQSVPRYFGLNVFNLYCWIIENDVLSLPSVVIQVNTFMETTVVRKATSFRLRTDLLEGLKRNAARENRTLNNYVESVLLDVVYHEPNQVTKAALKEAMNNTEYPQEELYSSAEELLNTLDQ